MSLYESQKCDICGKVLTKDDDIVVCPDCGAPFHRRCWENLGHCIHEAEHSKGYVWKPAAGDSTPKHGEIICPNCSRIMPEGTAFCENCGTPLNSVNSNENSSRPNTIYPPVQKSMSYEEYFEQMRQQSQKALESEIDGVAVKDMLIYIGPNATYYIQKFLRKESDKNYKPFCWSAFFISPFYFICRKMYKWAFISGFVNFILAIPSLVYALIQQGALSSEYMFAALLVVAKITYFLSVAASVIFGFIAIPTYKKYVTRDIKAIKQSSGGDRAVFYKTLEEKSGMSRVGVIISVFFLALAFFQLF
jgi:hypothetical protein